MKRKTHQMELQQLQNVLAMQLRVTCANDAHKALLEFESSEEFSAKLRIRHRIEEKRPMIFSVPLDIAKQKQNNINDRLLYKRRKGEIYCRRR